MGLCYQTSKWLDRLWAEHLAMSQPARQLVQTGLDRQGATFAGFPADLHARLYLPTDPTRLDIAPEWATQLHDLASELGEWLRLRVMCARNGFAAGIAAEAMLEQLMPHVPERPQEPAAPAAGSEPNTGTGDPDHVPARGAGQGAGGAGPAAPNFAKPDLSEAALRAALRRATRAARQAVEQAEAQLEGLSTPLGLPMPGTAVVRNSGLADLKAIRDAHGRLESSPRLRRIAELAGRLERLAAAKLRSKVNPGVGEVHGVGLSGDLARLLSSELVALRRPRLRLYLLARLLEGRALTYTMSGREPQSRGPIIVLLDESSSMRESGKDIWSKAVCLALLGTATRQRRAWHLVAFNGDIVREVAVPAGRATPADLQRALDHRCEGGTDFSRPVLRAIDLVRTSATMKQADVVIITDGEDSLSPAAVSAATDLTRRVGVSWFAVGVGPGATQGLQSLAAIATSLVCVRDTDDAELVVPVINLERESATPAAPPARPPGFHHHHA
jgi:hypothetical protein